MRLSCVSVEVPTIVGAHTDEIVVGTEGTDVVVTNGAAGAVLLGGDDLLCVTGEAYIVDEEYPAWYSAGPGDDRIDSSEGSGNFAIAADSGSDEVTGGPDTDRVWADPIYLCLPYLACEEPPVEDGAVDVVNLAGVGTQFTGGSEDVVNLGAGRDGLSVKMRENGGTFQGGPAADYLIIRIPSGDARSWKFDARSGRITRDGEQVAGLEGFSQFGLRSRGNFVFIGTDNDEQFTTHVDRSWTPLEGPIKVRMEGGNDRVYFRGGGEGARFDGGDGVDRFDFDPGSVDRYFSIIFPTSSPDC